MSGKTSFAKATAAERDALELGNEQVASGRSTERPNLRHLQEVGLVSSADRANNAAMAKAQASEAGSQALQSTMSGLRQAGPNSGAYRLGIEDATSAAGMAAADTAVRTDQNMDALDLQARAGMVDQALSGQTEAMKGFRVGVGELATADIARVRNRNMKAEQDANTFTSMAQGLAAGASGLATKYGTNVDAMGNLGFKDNFAGKMARAGFMNHGQAAGYIQSATDAMAAGPTRGYDPASAGGGFGAGFRQFFRGGERMRDQLNSPIYRKQMSRGQ